MHTTAWMAQRVAGDYAIDLQQRVRDRWLGLRQHHFDSCAERLTALAAQTVEELPHTTGKIGYAAPVGSDDARPTLAEAVNASRAPSHVIAAQAGISRDYLHRIIACQYAPRLEIRQRIAAALDTTTEALRWPVYIGQEGGAS